MAKGDFTADEIKDLGRGGSYTCAYCGTKFKAWVPVSGGLFTKYCSQACKDKAQPPEATSPSSSRDEPSGSSAAGDIGAAAAAYVIKKAGDAKKVHTMKAERDLALQALEIPQDADAMKQVFFSLASQVDFSLPNAVYSKIVVAKMGTFVPAWKASHSGRADFAVVLGLLEEEVQKAQAAQLAFKKIETLSMWAMLGFAFFGWILMFWSLKS